MFMRTFILLLLMTGFAVFTNAQTIRKVKATDVRMMMDTSTTPIIVNFWATWCAPCVEEIPLLYQVFRCWVVQGLPKGDLVLKDKSCSPNNPLGKSVGKTISS